MEKIEGRPRFHNKTVIPEVREGETVVKFHGEPARIPAATKEEPLYCGTRFTERQLKALIEMECQRFCNERLSNLSQYE